MARRSDEREAARAEYMDPGRKRAAKSISGSWRMICTSSTILSGGGSRKTGGILPPTGSPADNRETRTPRATPAAGHRRAT